MSKYGNFSINGDEYYINTPLMPRPQINYMWNDRILSGVNHFGGGIGVYGGRTTTYIDPQGRGRCSIINNGNRYFYLRDMETGEIWNPGWYPVKTNLEQYKCIHGLGFSIIESIYKGIEISIRVFVNESDPVEIWTVKVKNNTHNKKNLKIYSFLEFALSGYPVYCNYYATVHCKYDEKHNMIIAYNKAQERHHDWYNGFIASSLKVTGYETSKNIFLSNYSDISSPWTVTKGACTNSIAVGEDMVGVLENNIILNPSEKVEFHVLIGATNLERDEIEVVERLFKKGTIEDDFNKLLKRKRKVSEYISIDVPDTKVNNLVNKWIKQQIKLCAEIGRDIGKGFRDQLQDAWGIASFDSKLAKEKILETLRYQKSDGSCIRAWLPLDPHIYSDGPVWIGPTINAYLKETGDYDFLNIIVPYLDKGEDTVWEHILISVRYSSQDIGERGLVLAHDGDWNDSLNGIGIGGKGESVWTSIALYQALCDTAEMAHEIVKDQDIEKEMIERAVNKTGWDSEWYLAGYTDTGEKVGTHTEKEGSIYLNSQTWAIMTGIAEGERIERCQKAMSDKLDSPYGPLTLYPTYTNYNPLIGRLTSFVPGIWENGTPYCHGGTFKIVADCCAGRGNEAYETMLSILPDSSKNPSEYSGCEPYALTNMYFGPDNPNAGKTMFSWVTGTAGWMFRAVTQYILGFNSGYEYITIDPCIPDIWKKCSIRRNFRGDVYNIYITNPNKSQRGVKKMKIDGLMINGNSFKIIGDGKEHMIEVEL